MAKFIFRRITSGKVIKNKRENKNNSYFVLPYINYIITFVE